ncbi:hypothetical protein BDC45DRAFT_495746 [Circinella umbellata]|nr:hypothetical protein BDC45DRAFT_495746 [Circinella umbellata]
MFIFIFSDLYLNGKWENIFIMHFYLFFSIDKTELCQRFIDPLFDDPDDGVLFRW